MWVLAWKVDATGRALGVSPGAFRALPELVSDGS
eukprot:CAMPEP_0177416758 /NCGR_PEP_ID=MMETSP0368-20130122/68278_1 /TAXON_ID=447022 ORGANISM="Scrippsiella hangoei-like, Strain SHHI-4" /NCGR_SAMPLE_ID=MMETSP0368 /ASSEMBLY_ACC=CAM_ASM_000363 /LENGTH=33 /DNA_ID= /DNA_START= /DNA_END= /DNA_ORIENTATION=